MKGKQNNWKSVTIMLNGVELKGITDYTITPSLEAYKKALKIAEEKEEYELCAELKNKIDNYITE